MNEIIIFLIVRWISLFYSSFFYVLKHTANKISFSELLGFNLFVNKFLQIVQLKSDTNIWCHLQTIPTLWKQSIGN